MTTPLSMGSLVEITGPTREGKNYPEYTKFTISQIRKDEGFPVVYSANFIPWYPASSLRLLEELKTGDWVRVDAEDYADHGRIFQIKHIVRESSGDFFSDTERKHWPANLLRKLTPEEIQQHTSKTNTFTVKFKVDTSEFEEQLDKVADKMWKFQVDGRLSAIEKRLDAQKDAIIEMDLRLNVDAEAIKVLEGERPEVIDSPKAGCHWNGIMVTIQRGESIQKCPFRYTDNAKAWACRVLDGMREA